MCRGVSCRAAFWESSNYQLLKIPFFLTTLLNSQVMQDKEQHGTYEKCLAKAPAALLSIQPLLPTVAPSRLPHVPLGHSKATRPTSDIHADLLFLQDLVFGSSHTCNKTRHQPRLSELNGFPVPKTKKSKLRTAWKALHL